MAHFYCRDGGTRVAASGGLSSPLTGTFASQADADCFPGISELAYVTTFAAGDIIYVSESLDRPTIGTNDILSGVDTQPGILMTTVSDSDVTQPAICTSTLQWGTISRTLTFSGIWTLYGLRMKTGGSFAMRSCTAYNCELIAYANNDYPVALIVDGATAFLYNCALIGSGLTTHTSGIVNISSGAFLYMENCTAQTATCLTRTGFVSGGGVVVAKNCDFSGLGTEAIISSVGGDAANDDTIRVEFYDCLLSSGYGGFADESFTNYGQRLLAAGCGYDSGAEYQFHVAANGGVVDSTTAYYRTGSTALADGSTKISLKVVTDSTANHRRPFFFELPSRYCALSSTSSDVIEVYITSSVALTQDDIWVAASWQDDVNAYTHHASTGWTHPLNLTAAALTTNTEAWSAGAPTFKYTLTVDTSLNAGGDCIPSLTLFVAKPSVSGGIYICPTLGLS